VKFFKSDKLERKLTYRMVQVQILALLLFFGACVFPFVIYPIFRELGDSYSLNTDVAAVFAESLQLTDDGTLISVSTPGLTQLRAQFPDIWFYAGTRSNVSVALGPMPSIYGGIAENLWAFEGLDARMLDNSKGGVALRTLESPIGVVRVLTGNGPLLSAAQLIAWFLVALLTGVALIIGLVSATIIPFIVRREMKGLKAAAAQAQLINIRARGTRLSVDNVPDEVKPLVQSINAALARLDESYLERERFLADSAHELRTPIAIIQTRLEAEDPFPSKNRLLVDVARLSSLTDQLLDLQRMDLTGSIFSPIDLNELACEVVGDLAPIAEAAGYDIALTPASKEVIVNGDIGSLARALTNIVQNAISYGGRRGEILVEVHQHGSISVADEGPGIPPAERKSVFEPFYRANRSTGGTGLGLNLVDMIIRRHHGRVIIGDAPAGGALFIVELPLLSASAHSDLGV
jgi:signal transduction histidine kinase